MHFTVSQIGNQGVPNRIKCVNMPLLFVATSAYNRKKSRSEIDIEEIRKRICYILLAVLLIISLAFTAESFENVVAVDTKDSWSVRERADVLPDVAGNSLAIEDVLTAVNLAKALNLPEENLLVEAGSMTAEPAVMSAPAKTASAEATPNTRCSRSGYDNPNGRYYDTGRYGHAWDRSCTGRYGYAWDHRYAGSCSYPGDVDHSFERQRRRAGAFNYDRIYGCGFGRGMECAVPAWQGV